MFSQNINYFNTKSLSKPFLLQHLSKDKAVTIKSGIKLKQKIRNQIRNTKLYSYYFTNETFTWIKRQVYNILCIHNNSEASQSCGNGRCGGLPAVHVFAEPLRHMLVAATFLSRVYDPVQPVCSAPYSRDHFLHTIANYVGQTKFIE